MARLRRRGQVVVAVAGVAAVAGFYALRRTLGLEFDPESMHGMVERMGIWAPLVYVAIVTFRIPLGLPSQIVLIGGGLVFGALQGTLYGALGLLASASFMFFAARATGRDAILARVPRRAAPMLELAGTRLGALFLALGTGYPFGPITLYHLLAGVTGMAYLTFLLAVGLGASARAGMFTFFGSRLIEGEISGVLAAAALIAGAVVVPLLFPRTRLWLLQSMGRRPMPEAPPQR